MVDNLKEIVKAWRGQYRNCVDMDEKVVMILITVVTLSLIMGFLVILLILIAAFIKSAWWIIAGVLIGALVVRHFRKADKR